ncbi:putative Na(+)-translocating NADH-quinone reductase subunit C [Waddlia chondrophila 2032/99]|uniref:Na(+)-translocating NADH-quinone reductase subunit C n=1 Tax=Waddlia chondrophila 2032/99 TaxID=765953 RepID=F8LAU7_9BACT|nr:putative Na(+)-translocating NADH-quinone reductase subunit C [Waddlia chondrophila 2032/99]
MSEQQPQPKSGPSDLQIIGFVVILSLVCAIILAVMASALKVPQETAQELDRSQQMMIAARVFTHEGYFQIKNDKGEYVPAKYAGNGKLAASEEKVYPTRQEILDVYQHRFIPALVDNKGNIETFKEAGVDQEKYLEDYKKSGYYKQPEKLIYKILPNPVNEKNEDAAPIGYVIPVNGFGLWDAIYGYLAVETDGATVIGISWYEQKETPGLGANIAEEAWQKNFYGKKIFQPDSQGKINLESAPVGITVVKGEVKTVLAGSPKENVAVDGMPGATLTGNGVTDAYRDVLSAYRPFFIKVHNKTETQ